MVISVRDDQWTTGRMSTAYVVYRVIVAVLMVVWLIADFLYEAGRFYRYNYAIWLVFATNWSMLAVCVTACCMAVTSVYYYYATRYRALGIFSALFFYYPIVVVLHVASYLSDLWRWRLEQ